MYKTSGCLGSFRRITFYKRYILVIWLNGSVLQIKDKGTMDMCSVTKLCLRLHEGWDFAHLYIPKPKLRAVIWATSNKIVVIWTPCNIRNAVGMSF